MISQAIIIASIVLFINSCTWDGMIFEKIKKIIKPADEDHPDRKLYKAVYGCPICMTPYYGTLIYWLSFHNSLQEWLLTIGAASGFSVVSIVLLSLRDAALKYEDS